MLTKKFIHGLSLVESFILYKCVFTQSISAHRIDVGVWYYLWTEKVVDPDKLSHIKMIFLAIFHQTPFDYTLTYITDYS